ncbi:WXG100 family type VII secretion target [Catenulispora rubra]|uniref:WXG100 family type VII secretion target n=1 Tax=Catenulispora rubra TaxID=280293 RepID=UPI0018927187|nr:WXG100 family type VII secretion target [Catenulispora rubra]
MVDPTLQHEHDAMARAAGEFSSALDDLNSYVAPVRADHEAMQWQSDAATKYRELFDEWLIQFGDICKALETMREVLGASAKDYADNEAWAVDAVKTISGGGNDYTAAQRALLGM